MEYSQLVLQVRKTLRITQVQLASELGVSFSTVNRWEKGRANPNNLARRAFFQFCKDNNIYIDESSL